MSQLLRREANSSKAPNPPPRRQRLRSHSQDRINLGGAAVAGMDAGGSGGGVADPIDPFCAFPNRLKRNFSFNKTQKEIDCERNCLEDNNRRTRFSNLEINRTLSHQPLGPPFAPLFGPQIHPLMQQMWTTMGDNQNQNNYNNNNNNNYNYRHNNNSSSPSTPTSPSASTPSSAPITSSRLSVDYRPKDMPQMTSCSGQKGKQCADANQSLTSSNSSFSDHFNQYSSSRAMNRLNVESIACSDVTTDSSGASDDVMKVQKLLLINNKSTNDLKLLLNEEKDTKETKDMENRERICKTLKPIAMTRRTSLGGRKSSLPNPDPLDALSQVVGKEWTREQVSTLSHAARVGMSGGSGGGVGGGIGTGLLGWASGRALVLVLCLVNLVFAAIFYRLVGLVPNQTHK